MAVNELATSTGVPSFITWWLIEQPKHIWQVTIALTRKTIIFFSIPTLMHTLFAPWKRDIQRTSNLPIDLAFKGVIANLISRFVGFIVRSATIFIALCATLTCAVSGLVVLIFWTLLPLFIGLIIWLGAKA